MTQEKRAAASSEPKNARGISRLLARAALTTIVEAIAVEVGEEEARSGQEGRIVAAVRQEDAAAMAQLPKEMCLKTIEQQAEECGDVR